MTTGQIFSTHAKGGMITAKGESFARWRFCWTEAEFTPGQAGHGTPVEFEPGPGSRAVNVRLEAAPQPNGERGAVPTAPNTTLAV